MKRHSRLALIASLLLISVRPASQAFSQQGIITTFAGGGPNSSTALVAEISPAAVAVDAHGNIFIAGESMDQVFKVDPAGNFSVVAGNGTAGFGGDGGPASLAILSTPSGVALDTQGNLFIADESNQRIRRVDAATGIITTVVGSGQLGFSGDGGPAISAKMYNPISVAVDEQGNLFISDNFNWRIRRVDAATGTITTVAGNGQNTYSGDGGPATAAGLTDPLGVAVDAQGNLFIADWNFIRRVDAATGIITTYAGSSSAQSLGDGGPASTASLSGPWGVAVDAQGDLFIADSGNGRIRRVDAATQIINTVAGTFPGPPGGDGGPATSASITNPEGVAVDSQGDLFIADFGSGRIRGVDGISGIITTVAGGGSGGDGGPATSAVLLYPAGVAIDGSGNVFIVDFFSQRIRRVDATSDIITTAAGNGIVGYTGDGGPATSASFGYPYGVAADAQGNLFIADTNNNRIRRVDAVTGIITTVAGGGQYNNLGDGGPATSAFLGGPYSVALDAQGNLFIGDPGDNRVRRVDALTGIMTTVAGNGTAGFSGDGGPATSASLNLGIFGGVALDAEGNLFIADCYNNRIRRVDGATGIITTVAGTGESSSTGDGGPATSGTTGFPGNVAVDAQGNVFIAETRIRRVDRVTGIITSVAGNGSLNDGNGSANFGGDGGPATGASLGFAFGVALDSQGTLFISDTPYNRIRVVPLPPFVALTPAALSFSSQPEGTTSTAQTITLTNTGLVPLTISSIAIAGTNAGDYAETSTCGSSLAAGASCAISMTFTPTGTGSSSATLTVTDNAPGSPQNLPLSGTNQAPDFSLTVSGSPASATVNAGGTATYKLNITPLGGLSGTAGFTCTGAPLEATCTVNPASINLSGSASAPMTVTVSTTARSAIWPGPKPPAAPWKWVWMLATLLALGAILMRGNRLAWRHAWVLPGLAMLGLALSAGCGGSGATGEASGTPAGTYNLTVTGSITSGTTTLQHNVPLTLTVN
ncbi:MAG: choice-of-anchor D domain-containing protein [Terriglobia bacterium]